jgi:VWFA-related protein
MMRLGFIALCAGTLLVQQEQPHFTTRTEVVRVDALITNRGLSVKGLTNADFELRDNGVLQQITVMDSAALPVDVALALDISSSVEGLRLINLKRAATGLVDALRPGDRGALVMFNDLLYLRSTLTDNFDRLRLQIAAMNAIGRTSLRDAAYVALLQTDPEAGRALVVLFTDGQDNASFLTDDILSDTAKRINAVVYSVTLGVARNSVFNVPQDAILDALPRATGGRRLSADDPGRLREVFASILVEFRQRDILTYTPQGVDRSGYHALDVRLINGRKGEVHARPGYFRAS